MNRQFARESDNPVDLIKFEEEDPQKLDEELEEEEEEKENGNKLDYYAILGVSKNATEQEIKTAFRKKSREMHPDLQVFIFFWKKKNNIVRFKIIEIFQQILYLIIVTN